MKKQSFLNNDSAVKNLLRILTLIFVIFFIIGSFVYIIVQKVPSNQVLPLITFIIGTLIGGIGVYMWRDKK
jgi:uncharacterized membrane protein